MKLYINDNTRVLHCYLTMPTLSDRQLAADALHWAFLVDFLARIEAEQLEFLDPQMPGCYCTLPPWALWKCCFISQGSITVWSGSRNSTPRDNMYLEGYLLTAFPISLSSMGKCRGKGCCKGVGGINVMSCLAKWLAHGRWYTHTTFSAAILVWKHLVWS